MGVTPFLYGYKRNSYNRLIFNCLKNMDKELQDLAWPNLPKEFKKHIIKVYKAALEVSRADAHFLENIFGIDNLTSDAEGEEMLYVSRKEVQGIYKESKHIVSNEVYSSKLYSMHLQIMCVLENLFGAKCLPDSVADKDTFSSKKPKYHLGQRMYIKYINKIGIIDIVQGYNKEEDGIYYHLKVEPKGKATVREENLQPYEEPKPAEQNIPMNLQEPKLEPKKEVDLELIIKDLKNTLEKSITKEKYINIVLSILQGLLSSGKNRVVDDAFAIADALVKELNKRGYE